MDIRLIVKNKSENQLKIAKADAIQTNRYRDRVYRRPEPRSLTRQSDRRSRLSTQQVVTLASTSLNHRGDRQLDKSTRQRRKSSFELFRGIFSKKKKF